MTKRELRKQIKREVPESVLNDTLRNINKHCMSLGDAFITAVGDNYDDCDADLQEAWEQGWDSGFVSWIPGEYVRMPYYYDGALCLTKGTWDDEDLPEALAKRLDDLLPQFNYNGTGPIAEHMSEAERMLGIMFSKIYENEDRLDRATIDAFRIVMTQRAADIVRRADERARDRARAKKNA